MLYNAIACAMLAIVVGCTPGPDESLPPFVIELIARLEAEPKTNPPASIWRYNYKGNLVFYVPPSCCDVPSTLYTTDGSVVCGPDGGFGGRGDGRCTDFFAARTDEKLIWADER